MSFKTQITRGYDTDEIGAIHDRHTGYIVSMGDIQHFADGGIRTDGDRILDDTRLVFLNDPDLFCLVFQAHILVDYANTAFLGHGNRQARLGHRIHGC